MSFRLMRRQNRLTLIGLTTALAIAGCGHGQGGASAMTSAAPTASVQPLSRLVPSPGEHVLLIEGLNRITYLVRLAARGVVIYQPGVVGRVAKGGAGITGGFEAAVYDRPPDGWASRGAVVNSKAPPNLVDRLAREIDAITGFADIGLACTRQCATCPKPHYLPQERPSEPPLIIVVWRDHFSRPIGCDPRGRDVQRDALSLAADLNL